MSERPFSFDVTLPAARRMGPTGGYAKSEVRVCTHGDDGRVAFQVPVVDAEDETVLDFREVQLLRDLLDAHLTAFGGTPTSQPFGSMP